MASVYQNTESWMSELPSELTKLPINQLVIPGTHDSGAYYLDADGPVNTSESEFILRLVSIFGSCAKSVVKRWSLTQNLDITNQLKAGIRYLDMRTGYLSDRDDFFVVHSLYGYTMKNMLIQMNSFLEANPKEVLLIDFNQLYAFTPDLQERFANIIVSVFGDKIYPANDKGMENSIDDVRAAGKNIFIFHTNAEICNQFKFFLHGSFIDSPWFNTSSVDTLISELDNRFNTLEPGHVNVFQAILSPQTSTVVLHLCGGSLETTLAFKGNRAVCQWLGKVKKEEKKGVNVLIVDFEGEEINASDVIALNELLL